MQRSDVCQNGFSAHGKRHSKEQFNPESFKNYFSAEHYNNMAKQMFAGFTMKHR